MMTGLKREILNIKDRKKQEKLSEKINEMMVKESIKKSMDYAAKKR